jgi:hypothetical protein
MTKIFTILVAIFAITAFTGCTQHKVEVAPVKVEPIHITIDINVKVDKALDDFFDDIDSEEGEIESTPSSDQ